MLDADPEDYNPPLTRWGHVWRTLLSLALAAISWGAVGPMQWSDHRPLFWIDLVLGLTSLILVFFRRRWPFPIAVLLTLFGLASASSGGFAALAGVSLATRRKLPQIITVAVLSVVTGQLFTYYEPQPDDNAPWVNFTVLVVATVALCVFGMYVGSRRELLWTLRERARQAESAQELRVGRAQAAERERIAREMHDVLAHRISLVTMHAGALAYRTDLPPEQVRETAALIQQKAHEALADLRQVLGVLRSADGVGDRPQPTYGDLGALIAEATADGSTVDFLSELPDGVQPPDQIGRTVYRIIQEALTNARKHAVGAHVKVQVSGSPEAGLDVVVTNATRVGALGMPVTPGAGLGLIGLRERAELAGGTLSTESEPTRFVLRCWLPWT